MSASVTAPTAGYTIRRFKDRLLTALCIVATLVAVVPLLVILAHIASKGASALNLDFFTQLERPPMEGGGLAGAIAGTGMLVGLACAIGIPVGIFAGVYLSEFGSNRVGHAVRFAADVMSGLPSIVVGVFVYTLVVIPMGGPSALAGGIALAILMLPTVTRTTEELLRLVPDALREAALALGVPKWRSILRVVLRTAAPGIATGVILAIARATGETAPLLFTTGNTSYWPDGLAQPTASLTAKIFDYAGSPYEQRHAQAWAAALVLILFILVLNVGARLLVRQRGPSQ